MRRMKPSLKLFSSYTFCLEPFEINLIWSRRKLLEYDLQKEIPIRFQTTLMEIYYFVRSEHMSLEFYSWSDNKELRGIHSVLTSKKCQ